jgi:AbrB family looped-hinge helix DNA binding protein
MSAATLTSKGQITIPAAVRMALGLEAGDRVEFVETDKGSYAIIPATKSVRGLKGMIAKKSRPVSIEAMNAAIAARGSANR